MAQDSVKVMLKAGKRNEVGTLKFEIEHIGIGRDKIDLSGFFVSSAKMISLQISLCDEAGKAVEFSHRISLRKDLYDDKTVSDEDDACCGHYIDFTYDYAHKYSLKIFDGLTEIELIIKPKSVRRTQRVLWYTSFLRRAFSLFNLHNLKKFYRHISSHGLGGIKSYILDKVNSAGVPYDEWYLKNLPSSNELFAQREHKFDYSPKISIVVPTYKTPIAFLKQMMDSVIAQTYPNWELCIADGGSCDDKSPASTELEAVIKGYAQKDNRIKYTFLKKNMGISGNTNAALKLSTGDFVGLLDHDDLLSQNALYEVAVALNEDCYDVLYSDEDKVSADLNRHDDPNLKPDFSIDLLRSQNYITHFFVARKTIIDEIGGFRSEFDGSQDYDLILRCVEKAAKIKHIPQVLYHWRIHGGSVASNPQGKTYAYEAGRRAIEDHLTRSGIHGAKVLPADELGLYHVIYDTADAPLVSIIIPNKDHIQVLDTCVQSLINKNSYKNFEIIVVENASTDPETFEYYKKMQSKHPNFKAVKWHGTSDGKMDFNYSAINNFGVSKACGEYILFLNNDTEIIGADAVSELLGVAMRREVGAVGAKLLFANDTIQHAGVVVGIMGFAGHVFSGLSSAASGFMMRAKISGNYSAVTAACMMISKKNFIAVGGFSEEFAVALNDIDLCLKLREKGLLVVYNAFSGWHHYESMSRGYEDTPEKLLRFEHEVSLFKERWSNILKAGDPYYNPNFGYMQQPFTLKPIYEEK